MGRVEAAGSLLVPDCRGEECCCWYGEFSCAAAEEQQTPMAPPLTEKKPSFTHHKALQDLSTPSSRMI